MSTVLRCEDTGCPCTHQQGCEAGWLWIDEGTVRPCPICRAHRQPRPGEARSLWLHRLREQDASWARRTA